jgi:predicted flavoprotein YhiN
VLRRHDCDAIRAFFEELGLLTIADGQGWVFPRTRAATSVLNVLLNEVRRLGVAVCTGQEVGSVRTPQADALHTRAPQADIPQADIPQARAPQPVAPQASPPHASTPHPHGFLAESAETRFSAKALVLACGVVPLLGNVEPYQAPNGIGLHRALDGTPPHRVLEPTPVLGPLATDEAPLKGLDGVRITCRARLLEGGNPVAQESGELLFRRLGVSGIVAFDLSRFARPGQELSLDFFPEFTDDGLLALLARRHRLRPRLTGAEFLDGLLHTRLAQAILRRVGRSPTAVLDEEGLRELASGMKDYRLEVRGGPGEAQAQLTRGGLAVEGFDPLTLQSRTQPGLFAAGECLDVDGPCGGFNLHWAWASGLVAGAQAAAWASTGAALRSAE